MFRSTAALAGGVVVWVFVAANLVDIAVRGRDRASAVAAAALICAAGLAHVLLVRPRIVVEETTVRIVNPLRSIRVPFAAVTDVAADYTVRVQAGGRWFRSWSPQESRRGRMRARRRPAGEPAAVAAAVAGRTHVDWVAAQLAEAARAHRGSPDLSKSAAPETARACEEASGPVVSWSWLAVAAVALPSVALLAAILLP